MNGLLWASIIDFVNIQPSKSFSQTQDVKVLFRKPKAVYLAQTIEQRPWIRKFCLDNKKNSYN